LNECIDGGKEYRLKICCLGLRGDTGSNPVFNTNFNTTYDFVDFVRNPANSFMFSSMTTNPKYQGRKAIAINIQNGESDSPLIQEFLYNLYRAINDNNLNLDIISGTDRIF